jgi:hypothetical protein
LFLLFVASSLILSFRHSPFFSPEMSAGFMSYTVQIFPIYFTWSKQQLISLNDFNWNRGGSVDVATNYWLDGRENGVLSPDRRKISVSHRPDWFQHPPSLLSKPRCTFPSVKQLSVELTTHQQLPRLIMCPSVQQSIMFFYGLVCN